MLGSNTLNMAKAMADQDYRAFAESARACTSDEAASADDDLCSKAGRGHIGRLLDGSIPADNVRDALLGWSSDRADFNNLAAGFATAAVAACKGRPDLMDRAAELSSALIAQLPENVAEAVHTRSIYQMALICADEPSMATSVELLLYGPVEKACSERGSPISRGFFDPGRDPAMTPAGMAAMCDFKPALAMLAKSTRSDRLAGGFKRLAGEVSLRARGSTPMENIRSSMRHCQELGLVEASETPARARLPSERSQSLALSR